MKGGLPEDCLFRISRLLEKRMGLHFPEARWGELENKLKAASQDFGFDDMIHFIDWLLISPLTEKHFGILANRLTVGETHFFREMKTINILESNILPKLIQSARKKDKSLRIWSAACSTGEEPYTIAILLMKLIPDWKDWNISILATDINPQFLTKASEAVYTKWSFRDTPAWVARTYFEIMPDGHYQAISSLKGMATFRYLNLAEDPYPSLLNETNAMDLILCRNFFIYASPAQAEKVTNNFHKCLVNGGWLVVGVAEASLDIYSCFETLNISGITFYTKTHEKRIVKESPAGEKMASYGDPVREYESNIEVCVDRISDSDADLIAAIAPDPDNAKDEENLEKDNYAVGIELFRLGRYRDAAAEFLKATSVSSRDSNSFRQGEVYALAAKSLANYGKLSEALTLIEKAIASDKLNACHYYLKAIILQELGLADEAVMGLEKSLYLDPHFILAHYAFGNLMQKKGKMTAAKRSYNNTLDLLLLCPAEAEIPESGGITAARLKEITVNALGMETSI